MGAQERYELLDHQQLIIQVAAGDEHAFKEIFKRYAGSVSAVAFSILQHNHSREEILQEVFIKVWLHRDILPGVQHFGSWLKKVTLHESLDHLRKNAVYDKRLAAYASTLSTMPATTLSPILDYKELQEHIQKAIETMPEQRRTIFEMSRVHGLSAQEIASQLGISYGYVRNAISAALQTIREHLPPFVSLPSLLMLGICSL